MSKNRAQLEAADAEVELIRIAEEEKAQLAADQQNTIDEVARLNAEQGSQQAAAPQEPTPTAPINQQIDWEQRYRSLQGMFAKSNESISRLTEMNATLTQRLDALAQAPQASAAPVAPAQAKRFVTPDEVKDYGEEFLDVTKRAAREVYDEQIQSMAERINELQKVVKQQSETVSNVASKASVYDEDVFYNTLDKLRPTWEAENTNPQFLTWLAVTDSFTGVTRRALLNQAMQAKDASRVASFFSAFASESGAKQPTNVPQVEAASLVSPDTVSSGPNPSSTRRGKYWTQAEVEKVYDDKMSGKITHEQFVKLEKEVLDALADGRIR